jgi:hypothetical protein
MGREASFARTESAASVAESLSSHGSPAAHGPAGTYSVGAERSSIHNLTHLG